MGNLNLSLTLLMLTPVILKTAQMEISNIRNCLNEENLNSEPINDGIGIIKLFYICLEEILED